MGVGEGVSVAVRSGDSGVEVGVGEVVAVGRLVGVDWLGVTGFGVGTPPTGSITPRRYALATSICQPTRRLMAGTW